MDKMKRFTFKTMEEMRIYKNINCYDDQVYIKIKGKLYTGSKMSGGKLQLSSASTTQANFVDICTRLDKRFY